MTPRRSFIAGAAAAAGIAAATGAGAPAHAATTPSALARDLARSLQTALPAAKLSDELVAKIASDIEDNLAIATTFRKGRLRNADEPSCMFAADPAGEQP